MSGRPTAYTAEVAQKICTRLAEGESLRSICSDDALPAKSTVLAWACDPAHPFSDQYTRAREVQAEVWADEIIDISDENDRDWIKGKDGQEIVNSEAIQRAKLRVDSRKWYLSKVLPKKYGERQVIKHEFDDLSDEELIARAASVIGGAPASGTTP